MILWTVLHGVAKLRSLSICECTRTSAKIISFRNKRLVQIQAKNLFSPVVPNPVDGSCPINDDEVSNPVPDVFPNTPPLLVLVGKHDKPVDPIASVLHAVS